jgi:hypothetical protein
MADAEKLLIVRYGWGSIAREFTRYISLSGIIGLRKSVESA